jgi:hypothetical protein
MPLPLYSQYILNRRRSGPQRRSGQCEVEKTFSCLDSNNGRPARTSSLYRLSYPGSPNLLLAFFLIKSMFGALQANGESINGSQMDMKRKKM